MSRRLLLPALLLLGGCIDFREIDPVGPGREEPAQFRGTIFLEDDRTWGGGALEPTGERLRVSAVLEPGAGEGGAPRSVVNDTLWVSGVGLAPQQVQPTGIRLYDGSVPFPRPTEGGWIEITPPAVGAGGSRAHVFHHLVPARLGADTLKLAAGEDLRLGLAYPAAAESDNASWTLHLTGGGTNLVINGQGLPPTPLVVPASLLPRSPQGWLHARLQVHSHAGAMREEDPYFADVQLQAVIGWVVLLPEGK